MRITGSSLRFICVVPCVVACIAAAFATGRAPAASVCESAPYHQFDFFVGRWNVYDAGGHLVGTDLVQKQLNGCVVSERYTDKSGSVGIGLSGFQRGTGRWYQDFMDDRGLVLSLIGKPADGYAMFLRGIDYPKDGRRRLHRGVWSVHGAEVEELWTASVDGGKTWSTLFDGFFRRKP